MAHPTEQCEQIVRLTVTSPVAAVAASAFALPTMAYGSCAATAPAPNVNPERLRNVRRSIVLPRTPATLREMRDVDVVAPADFLVSNMDIPSWDLLTP
jgi:hypothetical protein